MKRKNTEKNSRAYKLTTMTALLLALLMLSGCSAATMSKGKDYFAGNSASGRSASEAVAEEEAAPVEEAAEEAAPEEEPAPEAEQEEEEIPAVEEEVTDTTGEAPAPEEEITEDPYAAEYTEEGVDNTFDIVFFGDSQFDNGRSDGTSIPSFVGNLTRADSVINFGCGGTCAAVEFRQRYRTYDEWVSPNFTGIVGVLTGKISDRILNGYAAKEELARFDASKVDYYVIAYGYNDYVNEHEIFNQEWHQDPSAFAYALMHGIDELRTISPNAKFVVCSPCYAQFFNAAGAYIGDGNIVAKGPYGYTLSDFAGSSNTVASDVGAQFFDAYNGGEIDLSAYTADQYLERDGVHLTFAGRNAYAQALAHNINKERGLDDTEQGIVRIADYR